MSEIPQASRKLTWWIGLICCLAVALVVIALHHNKQQETQRAAVALYLELLTSPKNYWDESTEEQWEGWAVEGVAQKLGLSKKAVGKALETFQNKPHADEWEQMHAYYLAKKYTHAKRTAEHLGEKAKISLPETARRAFLLAGEAREKLKQFDGAERDYREALKLAGSNKTDAVIETRNRLALVLWKSGMRLETLARSSKLRETEDLFRINLLSLSPQVFPENWAQTEVRLGLVQQELAKTEQARAATALLGRAKTAFESAFQIYTREKRPFEWSRTQIYLGDNFVQSTTNVQEKNLTRRVMYINSLLHQAAASYLAAFAIISQDKHPFTWASLQNRMGIALLKIGEQQINSNADDKLRDSVNSFLLALEVIHEKNDPQQWAEIQSSLGDVLQLARPVKSLNPGLLTKSEALITYENALRIHTLQAAPLKWATIQAKMGRVYGLLGTSGSSAKVNLVKAATAYENSLKVFTPENHPEQWAASQNFLGLMLRRVSKTEDATMAKERLCNAVAAYENALQIYTQKRFPKEWAITQDNLGIALGDLGMLEGGEEGLAQMVLASAAFENAWQVRTRTAFPELWAMTAKNMVVTWRDQAKMSDATGAEALLVKATILEAEVESRENDSRYR